eukprot:1721042-Rhodomonas_salina.1
MARAAPAARLLTGMRCSAGTSRRRTGKCDSSSSSASEHHCGTPATLRLPMKPAGLIEDEERRYSGNCSNTISSGLWENQYIPGNYITST